MGTHDGALVVRLTAPPVEGQANAALLRLLAGLLHRPATSVRIRQGRSGRDKVVVVAGADADTVRSRLLAGGKDTGR